MSQLLIVIYYFSVARLETDGSTALKRNKERGIDVFPSMMDSTFFIELYCQKSRYDLVSNMKIYVIITINNFLQR